ncbi:hypothetical protein BOX15_Mlig002190g2 [Macrostomum lignano]|uniref:Vesicle transport protein GOT1B n=1 Tax=Macrostomum lignano TaxID=282301 RepID=A0A267EJB6_9PLAT|nr:hypothetical protein BOX15_Mlig002190g2 [Macrostomum lignano]
MNMFTTGITDLQKIGIGLSGFGSVFVFLGMLLFFDRGLLAIGNILFLSGICFVIGLERTFHFFFKLEKLKGTAFFFGGILIVLFVSPILGMLLEFYGFFVLFSGFFPVVLNFMSRVPVIGPMLDKWRTARNPV